MKTRITICVALTLALIVPIAAVTPRTAYAAPTSTHGTPTSSGALSCKMGYEGQWWTGDDDTEWACFMNPAVVPESFVDRLAAWADGTTCTAQTESYTQYAPFGSNKRFLRNGFGPSSLTPGSLAAQCGFLTIEHGPLTGGTVPIAASASGLPDDFFYLSGEIDNTYWGSWEMFPHPETCGLSDRVFGFDNGVLGAVQACTFWNFAATGEANRAEYEAANPDPFPGQTGFPGPACEELTVNWDPVGQQIVTRQRFTVTKPSDATWEELFIRASFSYGFDEFFSHNPARTSLYNAVQLAIYFEPVIISTDGNTRTFERIPHQPLDNDFFNIICQPFDSFAGDDVSVYRRSNGDGGDPEPEGVRGLRPCLYVNMLFETPTSNTRTVEFFIPSNAPLTMGDPGGIIDLEYGQVLDGGLRREVGPFDSFSDGSPPFTTGPVDTAGTVDVEGALDGEFGRQFVVCTDALGEVLFEEPQRPEDGGTTRGVGGPLLINPDAVDGWNTDVTLDPVSGLPTGEPIDGVGGGIGGDPGGGPGSGGSGNQGSGPGGDACNAEWGYAPWSWGGSALDEMKCALSWAFIPGDDLNVSFTTFKDELFGQFPFSLIVLAEDFLGELGNELENASGSGCFTGAAEWSFGEYGTVDAGDVCIGDNVTVNTTQRALVLTLMLAPMVWVLLSMTWHMILGKNGGIYPDGTT